MPSINTLQTRLERYKENGDRKEVLKTRIQIGKKKASSRHGIKNKVEAS